MEYIQQYNDKSTFSTKERCDINELLNTPDDENYINLENEDKYKPVSCQLHSELELAVMHHTKLEIELTEGNNVKVRAIDIFTQDKCEYLKVEDTNGGSRNIRLDKISSYKVFK